MQPLEFSSSPRCQIIPLPSNQVAFVIDGRERLRWHASEDAPRPFFFPLTGPSGIPLTRMGHPGAPDHDHHRSVWFAHHMVDGESFWSDTAGTKIRQTQWVAYDDGDDEARMAVRLEWLSGADSKPLIKQDLYVAVAPAPNAGLFVELQTSLRSVADTLELGKTNFGLLAVRVAKAISARFGDGVITGANGKQGEKDLFGLPSPWIDYSGSIDKGVVEGITYFDHSSNSRFPSKWHVRADGWMGASACFDGAVTLYKDKPTSWRYLLHAHPGAVDHGVASQIQDDFHDRPPMSAVKGGNSQSYTIKRG
ncbi:PmoA family protein [Novipirellula sp. SH528]|uniref:DUF6807 domain-containing protein n=1 Tax=Novipirellula sp. SH528 TaxID=3454466 RepID=UPI003F9FA6FC